MVSGFLPLSASTGTLPEGAEQLASAHIVTVYKAAEANLNNLPKSAFPLLTFALKQL